LSFLSLYNAGIAKQSDYMAARLIRFVEHEEFWNEEAKKEVRDELLLRITAFPELAPVLARSIMHVYANKIQRLCDEYDTTSLSLYCERECV